MLFVVFKIVGDSMYNSIYILILAGVHGQAGLAVAVLCVAGGGKLSAVHCPDSRRHPASSVPLQTAAASHFSCRHMTDNKSCHHQTLTQTTTEQAV